MTIWQAEIGKEYKVVEIKTSDEELNSFLFSLGCYAGEGIDVEYNGENILQKLIRTISDFFETLIHEIAVIFD